MRKFDAQLIVDAYCQGLFPMGDPDGTIRWYSPDPRGVLPVDEFKIPKSVEREVRTRSYEIRVNTAFAEVMKGCADREDTWIQEKIFREYTYLHHVGLAHSVEVWENGELSGGLYGVAIRGAYFGESMFSRTPGASKLALVWLMKHLKNKGFVVHDTQWTTPHLQRFGGQEISRDRYLGLLEQALEKQVGFGGD